MFSFLEARDIIKSFDISGEVLSCEPYGEGHINNTFLVTVSNESKTIRYILQRINSNLFTDVDKLMSNITAVTEHIRAKLTSEGLDPDRGTLTVIKTLEGGLYTIADGKYYRMYLFIENATAYQTVAKPEDFYYSAVAFGEFNRRLGDFDASTLYEILPNFHNTVVRFANFKKAVEEDVMGRAHEVQPEIDFVLKREWYYSRLVDLLDSGEMPLRVTHNDTKLNNVMLDNVTGEPVAVIDLDTVMPGSLCYDFGDSIRFGCNPCGEDERNLSKVNFRIDLYETYLRGFLSSVGDVLTDVERDNLAMGAIMMTIECGMRFLTDYLEGDTYFRTTREGQNLDRCRTQFKLVSDMEKVLDTLNEMAHNIR